MSDQSDNTVIAKGTEFDGVIKSECGIVLSGKVKGEIEAPTLTVNKSGAIDGLVQVLELNSEGEISGEIEADTVVLSGKVNDKTVIRANSLEVKLSDAKGGHQVTFGDCQLKVGKAPAKSDKAPIKMEKLDQIDRPEKIDTKTLSDLDLVEAAIKAGK